MTASILLAGIVLPTCGIHPSPPAEIMSLVIAETPEGWLYSNMENDVRIRIEGNQVIVEAL
jgi:hypothetical protein